jgi:hypothetical protein
MTGPIGDLLRPITRGDLRGWQGLTLDLTLSELTSAFPPDSDWSGSAQLGRHHRAASYKWIRFPGADTRARAWFISDRVVLVDIANPPVTVHPNELTDIFAEPEEPLDTWQGTLPMPASELVFPRHGIAVFINRDTGAIWHLALFHPVTLECYEDDIRIDLQTRRHQPPRI